MVVVNRNAKIRTRMCVVFFSLPLIIVYIKLFEEKPENTVKGKELKSP